VKTFLQFLKPSDANNGHGFSLWSFWHAGPIGRLFFFTVFVLLILLFTGILRPKSTWIRHVYFPLALLPLYFTIFIMTGGIFFALDILHYGHDEWKSWMDLRSLDEYLSELLALLLTGSIVTAVFFALGYLLPHQKSHDV
jgi:hypothetical protein